MNDGELQFSARTGWGRQAGEWARAVADARKRRSDLVDLTESNPTRCGLHASEELLAKLGDPAGADYQAEPFGALAARKAVAAYYARRDSPVDPEKIALTVSSSESYSWLFKLLCDPGDVVLAPRPSYPLFPFLAELESVRLVHYPLLREDHWRVDIKALEQALSEHQRARAIIMVHPANPTGNYVCAEDALKVAELAKRHGVALIFDEVFADYAHRALSAAYWRPVTGLADVLCFTLNGLSKVAMLPQLKLAWLVCRGPAALVDEARARLELIADTYLSVATSVQLAVTDILAEVDEVQSLVRQRLGRNLGAIDLAISQCGAGCPVRRLESEGGWYSIIDVPRTRSDDEWVQRLIEEAGVIVQPAYLFDVEEPGSMVLSLLVEPAIFQPAIERAVKVWSAA